MFAFGVVPSVVWFGVTGVPVAVLGVPEPVEVEVGVEAAEYFTSENALEPRRPLAPDANWLT